MGSVSQKFSPQSYGFLNFFAFRKKLFSPRAYGAIILTPDRPRATDYWFRFAERSDEFYPPRWGGGPKSPDGSFILPGWALFFTSGQKKKVYPGGIIQRRAVAKRFF